MTFDELITEVKEVGQKVDTNVNGKLDPVVGYTLRKIKVDGDIGKALEFSNLLKKARQA